MKKSKSELNEGRPACVGYAETKVTRFRDKFEALEKTLETDFASNQFLITINSLKRSYKSVKNSLTSCQKSNPDYNFSNDIANVESSLEDFDSFLTAYEAKLNGENTRKDAVYKLGSYFNFLKYYGFIDGDLLTKDEASDLVDSRDESVQKMESIINGQEFKDNGYNYLDKLYADYDKEEAIETSSKMTKSLKHIQNFFFPNNKNLEEILNYSQKLKGKLVANQNAALSQIAVSDFHLNNINKIKFTSNINLDPTSATESDFKTEFTAGEQIKAIVYLDDKLTSIYPGGNTPGFSLKTSSSSNRFTVEGFKASDFSLSYIEFYISLDASNYQATVDQPCEAAISMDFLGELPPRSHNVQVKINSEKEPSGSFYFNADNDAGLQKITTEKVKIRDKHLANIHLPKARMQNSSYEKQLIDVFNSSGWEEVFKKAIITSSDWGYVKNWEGIVIGRTLQVAMVSTKNGGCMYQDFTVIQDKVGAEYGSFRRHSTGSQVDISCSKLK